MIRLASEHCSDNDFSQHCSVTFAEVQELLQQSLWGSKCLKQVGNIITLQWIYLFILLLRLLYKGYREKATWLIVRDVPFLPMNLTNGISLHDMTLLMYVWYPLRYCLYYYYYYYYYFGQNAHCYFSFFSSSSSSIRDIYDSESDLKHSEAMLNSACVHRAIRFACQAVTKSKLLFYPGEERLNAMNSVLADDTVIYRGDAIVRMKDVLNLEILQNLKFSAKKISG